jgi:hypothetical protein
VLSPHLESLPEPQQRLWPELKDTPKTFVLYGGTAIALYLGHRQSEDFDFPFARFKPPSLDGQISSAMCRQAFRIFNIRRAYGIPIRQSYSL